MENRNFVTKVLKSDDPDKLLVYNAKSMKDRICFYISEDIMSTAIECDGGCRVLICSTEKNKKTIFEEIKSRPLLFGICLLFLVLVTAVLFKICWSCNQNIMFLPLFNAFFAIAWCGLIITIDIGENNEKIRSKHSAEHMMINYLETNKRLPKTVEEVRKYSRFSKNCGGRLLFDGLVESLMCILLSTVISEFVVVITKIIFKVSNNNTTDIFNIFFILLYVTFFMIMVITKKQWLLNIVAEKIKTRLSLILQYFSTTKNVRNEDIILAYYAAKPWIQIVYPEFYNADEDDIWLYEGYGFLKS